MKKNNFKRTNLEVMQILDIRKRFNFVLDMDYNSNLISRLSGILFGLLSSKVLTFSTYERFEKLLNKIENKQIISLRK